jgi:pyrroline-5-carboxylate reductase
MSKHIAILGTGSIGRAVAEGLVAAGQCEPEHLHLTRRHAEHLEDMAERGFQTTSSNPEAVAASDIVIVAVEPHHLDDLLIQIAGSLEPERHVLISVVSGAGIAAMRRLVGPDVPIVRAMPNTAIALRESMTCLAGEPEHAAALSDAAELFDAMGATLVIDEEQMVPATALCACGVAFFLRAVRAACQGGIEIGFHPDEALRMAAQTALGSAALVREHGRHPEREIDAVTTPRGCTIAGLNEMEHRGFSSALIKGITTSSEKAESLYSTD